MVNRLLIILTALVLLALNVLNTYISASILPPISNASKDLRMVSSSSVPKMNTWLVEKKDRKTKYIIC